MRVAFGLTPEDPGYPRGVSRVASTSVPSAGLKGSRSGMLSGALRSAWTVLAPFLGLLAITALFALLTGQPKFTAPEYPRPVAWLLGWAATPEGLTNSTFLTAQNWRLIAVQSVVVGIAALGMTLIMIAGGIDLSVGSAVALITVAVAVLVRDHAWAVPAAMAAGVVVGMLCGLVNGALITALGVVPFIITLGSMKVFRGLAKWVSSSTQVYLPRGDKPWWLDRVLAAEPTPSWLTLAPGVWILLGLAVLLALVLRYTLLGRYIYAIGSNEATARLCGLNVPGIKLTVYALAGAAFGVAGVMQMIFLNGEGDPVTADGLELQVIAAVVIGGGSLSGGEGTVLGTLIGCLIMSVLNNGCVHAGISNASQDIIIGLIIVAAVTLDRLRRRGGG
jgi:ribose/xylose/arabinose/galactoside ABC-type transport system permease subunit